MGGGILLGPDKTLCIRVAPVLQEAGHLNILTLESLILQCEFRRTRRIWIRTILIEMRKSSKSFFSKLSHIECWLKRSWKDQWSCHCHNSWLCKTLTVEQKIKFQANKLTCMSHSFDHVQGLLAGLSRWWRWRWTAPHPRQAPPHGRWTAPPPRWPPCPQPPIPTCTKVHTPPRLLRWYFRTKLLVKTLKPDNVDLSPGLQQCWLLLVALPRIWAMLGICFWKSDIGEVFLTCNHQLNGLEVANSKWVEGGTGIISLVLECKICERQIGICLWQFLVNPELSSRVHGLVGQETYFIHRYWVASGWPGLSRGQTSSTLESFIDSPSTTISPTVGRSK